MPKVYMNEAPVVQTVGADGIGVSPPVPVEKVEKISGNTRGMEEVVPPVNRIPNPIDVGDGAVIQEKNNAWQTGADLPDPANATDGMVLAVEDGKYVIADSSVQTDVADLVADPYSTDSTYDVGDIVVYENKLYVCKTAIATAEAWTAAHWDEKNMAEALEDGLASQSEKINGIYTGLPYDNLLSIEAFKEKSVSNKMSISYNDGSLIVTATSNIKWGSANTPEGYLTEYCTIGKKYRVHFSAEAISGDAVIRCAVRGTEIGVDEVAAYGGSDSSVGGTFEFDFVMTEYANRLALFVTYATSTTASVRYYDFWMEEITNSAIDLESRNEIELNTIRDKNTANGFVSLGINNLYFERGGILSSGSNMGKDYNGDATYQAKSLRTCGWFSIDSYYGDIYFIANSDKVYSFKVLHKLADQSIVDIGVIDANHPICVTNSVGDSYRIGLTWNNAEDAYKASEWSELIDIAYYPTRLMALTEKSQSKKQYCIMTQNVGEWYNGTGTFPDTIHNSALALHNKILKRYSPDILACQEYKDFKTLLNPIYSDQYSYFPNTNNYVGKFVGTNYGLEDSEGATYTNQDSGSTLLWNYTKSYVWLNGRKVCVIATHLSTTSATGVLQVQELFDIAEEEDYVIICGDFNADCDSTEDQNYIDYYKPFVDAGYNLANCSTWGFMPTWYQAPDDASPLVLDNIITSGNIAIKYACVDSLKREEPLDGTKVDHLPLIAYIEFDD